MPSFDDVHLFVLTVRHQGISAAAKAAGLQRSKVSRRLQELEKKLGYKLLIRSTRKIELTEQGDWLYQQVQSSIDTLNDAVNLMQSERLTPQGRLCVAIPPALGMTAVFSELVERYISLYPLVNLEIEHEKHARDLRRSNTDLQILPSYVPTMHDDYVQQRLLQFSYSMVASESYLQQHGTPDSIETLSDHLLLVSRYNKDMLPEHLNYHLYSDDLYLLRKLVIAGKGIAVLPNIMVDGDIQQGTLQKLLPELVFAELKMTLIYPSQPYLPEKTRAIVELLHQSFSRGLTITY